VGLDLDLAADLSDGDAVVRGRFGEDDKQPPVVQSARLASEPPSLARSAARNPRPLIQQSSVRVNPKPTVAPNSDSESDGVKATLTDGGKASLTIQRPEVNSVVKVTTQSQITRAAETIITGIESAPSATVNLSNPGERVKPVSRPTSRPTSRRNSSELDSYPIPISPFLFLNPVTPNRSGPLDSGPDSAAPDDDNRVGDGPPVPHQPTTLFLVGTVKKWTTPSGPSGHLCASVDNADDQNAMDVRGKRLSVQSLDLSSPQPATPTDSASYHTDLRQAQFSNRVSEPVGDVNSTLPSIAHRPTVSSIVGAAAAYTLPKPSVPEAGPKILAASALRETRERGYGIILEVLC